VYKAYFTIIENVQKDPNSDNLHTATCLGESVIVGGESSSGQHVLYLPADGQLSYEFALKMGLLRKDKDGNKLNGYLDYPSMHIKALKLRGLRSEGIAISMKSLVDAYPSIGGNYDLGDEIDEIDGKQICKKYVPRQRYSGGGNKTSTKGKKAEGIQYPDFSMHTDTSQLAYNQSAFHEGDIIHISLKLHGTSQRSMRTLAHLPRGFWRKLFRLKAKIKEMFVLGTRRTVVTERSDGFYGSNDFRLAHHKKLEPHVPLGMEIFYEVVGYVNAETTIMPTCNNALLKDKEFKKQFGETTTFTYGCTPGESEMYVYRINDNGKEYNYQEIMNWCVPKGIKYCPQVDCFVFTTWEDLMARVNDYCADLVDPIDKTHVKEGVIVRIQNRKSFSAFKFKTYEFKVLEGIIKENAVEADIEEAEEFAET
jgi:hypothetical protein